MELRESGGSEWIERTGEIERADVLAGEVVNAVAGAMAGAGAGAAASAAASGQASPEQKSTEQTRPCLKGARAGDPAPKGQEAGQAGADTAQAGDHAAIWARIVTRLRAEYGEDIYKSWFKGLAFVEISDMTIVLSVPTQFLRMWIRTNYGARLLALWRAEKVAAERLDIRVRGVETAAHAGRGAPARNGQMRGGQARTGQAPGAQASGAALRPSRRAGSDDVAATQPAGSAAFKARGGADGALESAPLDPRHRFESFAVGASNKIAHETAMAVARSGSDGTMFNPLFIHGGVGRGKTHLLHAIAWEAARANPGKKILYMSADQFVFRFVAALRNGSAIAFKEALRSIDLLLIDDLQFLQGKATHREFSHTMNAMIEGCRQVVIVADRPPCELDGFDERTRSRLAGGLVAAIGTQELALRRQILEARVVELARRGQKIDLPGDVLDYVARSVASSGRELEGALNRLAAYCCYAGMPITVELAERVIRDLVDAQERPQIRIEDIQRVVAGHYHVSRADLVSSRRTRAIVVPRQIAMFLAKTLTPRSLPEIGRRFGNRDHTTVLHAVRKIEKLVGDDKGLARDIDALKRRIEDGEA